MAVAATVTALAALAVAVWDNVQQREFNRLSVMPRVNAAMVRSGADRGRLLLSNQGVGPAILRSIRIAVCGGNKEFDSWSDAQARLEELGVEVIAFYDFNTGEALGTGESLAALTFETEGSADAAGDRLGRLIEAVALELRYESIYGETFHLIRNGSCLPV